MIVHRRFCFITAIGFKLRVKPAPLSSAERSKQYREKRQSTEWLDAQADRMREYRANMSEEKRKKYNEQARERMAKMRARKAAAANDSQKKKPISTRSEAAQKEKLREYKTAKQREYRANMSTKKKNGIKKKDAAYRRVKTAELKEREKEEKERKKEAKALRAKKKAEAMINDDIGEKISHMIDRATPKSKASLERRNLYRSKVRKNIVDTLNTLTKSHKKEVVRTLRRSDGLDKKAVSKIIGVRRPTLSYKPKGGRSKNHLKVTPSVQEVIANFYKLPEISTQMPNKRRSGPSNVYILNNTILKTYREFKIAHPDVSIGVTQFLKHKPKCVQLLKKFKWMQCVCDICFNIQSLISAISASMARHNFILPDWLTRDTLNIGLQMLCSGSESCNNLFERSVLSVWSRAHSSINR